MTSPTSQGDVKSEGATVRGPTHTVPLSGKQRSTTGSTDNYLLRYKSLGPFAFGRTRIRSSEPRVMR